MYVFPYFDTLYALALLFNPLPLPHLSCPKACLVFQAAEGLVDCPLRYFSTMYLFSGLLHRVNQSDSVPLLPPFSFLFHIMSPVSSCLYFPNRKDRHSQRDVFDYTVSVWTLRAWTMEPQIRVVGLTRCRWDGTPIELLDLERYLCIRSAID